MTAREFRRQMTRLASVQQDPEHAHKWADELLIEMLRELARGLQAAEREDVLEGVYQFNEVEKWYA